MSRIACLCGMIPIFLHFTYYSYSVWATETEKQQVYRTQNTISIRHGYMLLLYRTGSSGNRRRCGRSRRWRCDDTMQYVIIIQVWMNRTKGFPRISRVCIMFTGHPNAKTRARQGRKLVSRNYGTWRVCYTSWIKSNYD